MSLLVPSAEPGKCTRFACLPSPLLSPPLLYLLEPIRPKLEARSLVHIRLLRNRLPTEIGMGRPWALLIAAIIAGICEGGGGDNAQLGPRIPLLARARLCFGAPYGRGGRQLMGLRGGARPEPRRGSRKRMDQASKLRAMKEAAAAKKKMKKKVMGGPLHLPCAQHQPCLCSLIPLSCILLPRGRLSSRACWKGSGRSRSATSSSPGTRQSTGSTQRTRPPPPPLPRLTRRRADRDQSL